MAEAAAAAAAVCGACGQAFDGQHCCKQCKTPLHSYVFCSEVYVPDFDWGFYFCNGGCIKAYNAANDALYRQTTDDKLRPSLKFPIRRRPDEEEQLDDGNFLQQPAGAPAGAPAAAGKRQAPAAPPMTAAATRAAPRRTSTR